jgi:CRP-like cAMP-binding protein
MDDLKNYCKSVLPFTEAELTLADEYFVRKRPKQNEYLLRDGEICDFIAFIVSGSVRHFHIKGGDEKTCDVSFENQFITDFKSLTYNTRSELNLQALETTELLIIYKEELAELYSRCPKYETFGRMMAELVAMRATKVAMTLGAAKPEERYAMLIEKNPILFQRVPQKFIANILGISPESLSRIRKRLLGRETS